MVAPDLRTELESFWPGPVEYGQPLAELTTLRVGGPAEAVIAPASRGELANLIEGLNRRGITWRVIGRGSNILVADRGIAGAVIVLGRKFSRIERLAAVGGRQLLRAEAGCSLTRLLNWCGREELTGLEFLAGIPGSLGGAVRMNAGAWGDELGRHVEAVEMLTAAGEFHTLPRSEMSFTYRSWSGKREEVVVAATLVLNPGSRAEINGRCRALAAQRRAKQPRGVASAGSFFRNPPGQVAGRLIEEAGLKGFSAGGAEVSRKHANFLINRGGATAADFLALMSTVQEAVRQRTGVRLEPEVELLGEWDGVLETTRDDG